VSRFERNTFARDLAHSVALNDARRAENAATRARMQASEGLCAVLLARARRRGENAIDWPEYFRNLDVAQ
jgi:hypothetical protein